MDFTRKNYKWTLGGLSKCIEDNKLESQIVAYTDTAAIVHVKNYHDSQILGAESDWCISQHKSSWEQYVSKNKRIQLFFYNFSKFVKDNMDLVGATFVADKKNVSLFCCFGKNNHPINEYYAKQGVKSDSETLERFILIDNFGYDLNNTEFKEIVINAKKDNEEKQPTIDYVASYSWPVYYYPDYDDDYDVLYT